MDNTLSDQIQTLMRENRRRAGIHEFTVPSPDIYPFQWLWDSCFHAIILSHFDVGAAKAELRSACAQPLSNGLLPHIIYWSYDGVHNWGREMRGDVINAAWGVVGTSAITQPPFIAFAAWRVYEADRDTQFLQDIYSTLSNYYRLLRSDRILEDSPLSFIINPDESGEDNSPRFDNAQGLMPSHTAVENLDRQIDRMRENAACNFMARTCMSKHFAIVDLPFNILLAESLEYLSKIALVLGEKKDASEFEKASTCVSTAIKQTLCDNGICSSYDAISNEYIETKTWALFMPLYGGLLSQAEADALIKTHLINVESFWTEFPVPSTAIREDSFDPKDGFWRGPVWMAPNWFIYKGLKRYGHHDTAEAIKEKTIALLKQSGFREQYNPFTGEGLGAHNFTWGGLVLDMN